MSRPTTDPGRAPGSRVHYRSWGSYRGPLPQYAVLTDADDGDALHAITRAIQRHTGLEIVTCRDDGTNDGRARYELQLGQRISGGGYGGHGQLTIAIAAQ